VLPWTYFAEAMRRASTGLVTDADLVRKIYFPRLIIPLSAVTGPLVEFFIGLLILAGMMIWYGVEFSWRLVFLAPLILVALGLALAVGLILSPLNVRFRDVMHTLPFVTQIWMYASPIVYPVSMVPDRWVWLYSLNPMVGVIEAFRWAVLAQASPNVIAIVVSLVVIVVGLTVGLVFFRHSERTFADVI
jgi:lipopolysaccharide transport system permease protein